MSARGCAGAASGEPKTKTIDVAKGIATSGNAVEIEKASMMPMATAPPAAPARIGRRCFRSDVKDYTAQKSVPDVFGKREPIDHFPAKHQRRQFRMEAAAIIR